MRSVASHELPGITASGLHWRREAGIRWTMEEAHLMRAVGFLVAAVIGFASVTGCFVRREEVDNCTLEQCNGRDDDCDNLVDEGFDLGVECDGPDSDMCADGITVCG